MLLNLKDVFVSDGMKLNFDYNIDLSGMELNKGDYPFREPVAVSGSVQNRAGVVTLKAAAKFKYFTRCDRCFQEIVEQNKVCFENVLVSALTGEGSDDLLVVENDQLDLDELAVSNIILNIPMKHLCSAQCKGLCPVCGKNLNEGPCGCSTKEADSRFASLKDFFK